MINFLHTVPSYVNLSFSSTWCMLVHHLLLGTLCMLIHDLLLGTWCMLIHDLLLGTLCMWIHDLLSGLVFVVIKLLFYPFNSTHISTLPLRVSWPVYLPNYLFLLRCCCESYGAQKTFLFILFFTILTLTRFPSRWHHLVPLYLFLIFRKRNFVIRELERSDFLS